MKCMNMSSFFSGHPLVSVKYSAIWILNEVLPSTCDNRTAREDACRKLLFAERQSQCSIDTFIFGLSGIS